METKAKHTPGPWGTLKSEKEYLDGTKETVTYIKPINHATYVAQINGEKENYEANAAFIVRACNSHYELLEACKALIAPCTLEDHRIAMEKAEKAIAKAECR